QGGYPKGSTVLISGSPGTGKTILCMQFLYSGAIKGSRGIFASFNEVPEALKKEAAEFGWDFEKLEKEGKIRFLFLDVHDIDASIEKIKEAVNELKAERLVIDSLSSLISYAPFQKATPEFKQIMEKELIVRPAIVGDAITRAVINDVIDKIKKLGCTTLMITEMPKESEWLSRDTISEFACDGVIVLKRLTMEKQVMRTITVEKMRMTKIEEGVYEMEITENGINVIIE
ncbi:MAG: ATPase domain-containing protein, partial [Candidatus Nanoarchaeia archaeon]|nr:hypothetical protein [Candidatus Jingweiarchaeum tengchongense]